MVKPDIIMCYPNNCDFPLWRTSLGLNRDRYNEVIIAITETNSPQNYTEHIKQSLSHLHVQFVIPPPTLPGEDWRNVATNMCLLHSYNAEWILFTEQDFIITDYPAFFEEIEEAATYGYKVMGYYEGTRLHPCFILIHRSELAPLKKVFSIIPNAHDHFYQIQKQLDDKITPIYKVANNCYHLNGLSSNMSLVERGGQPNYKPQEFYDYIQDSLQNMNLSPVWTKTFTTWQQTYHDNLR